MTGRRALIALWLALTLPGAGQAELAYRAAPPDPLQSGQVLIDTRPQARCLAESLAGARCLPQEDFFGPHRRLASFRDIAWVLGTAGLRGDETALVIGDDVQRRDAVAALLHLAGQAQVQVVTTSLGELLATSPVQRGPGRGRSLVRDPIFLGQMREAHWLLRDELAEQVARGDGPRILDGRPSPAYWGEWIRASRGGHVPGAESAPEDDLRSALEAGRAPLAAGAAVIAYAHDPYAGLAYLTLLRAGLGVDARLYGGGWREWAADQRLPVDAVSHPDRSQPAAVVVPAGGPSAGRVILIMLAVISAVGFGFMLGRRTP